MNSKRKACVYNIGVYRVPSLTYICTFRPKVGMWYAHIQLTHTHNIIIYICVCVWVFCIYTYIMLYYIYLSIYIYICEPPSKSIADAWYENIGYRFFCGALSHLSLYSVLFKSTLNNAKMQRNWLHRFRSLSCRDWIKGRSLSLRLPSCWGAI